MSTTAAIARREFRTFFNSPIAYIVLGAFLLVSGWLFFQTLFVAGQASLRGFFGLAPVLFVVFAPAITMRLLAEERKSGTLELLLTLPIEDWEVVLGKFLAALGMVAVGLACTLPYAFSVSSLVAPGSAFDWGPVIAGYLGLVLLASSLLAMSLWASAVSRNQIVGFVIGLVICFVLYLIDKLAIFFPASISELLQFLSVDHHFTNIARGVLDSRDLVFYLSLTAAGLVLTTQTLAAARK
jgi:ABC-2 type transport system permease protein